MSVILRCDVTTNAEPMLAEVNKDLGEKATQIYLFLWDLAVRDVEHDTRKHLPWHMRRDCGGLTYVSVDVSPFIDLTHPE